MRRVEFDPDGLADPTLKEWFGIWQARAEIATNRVVQAWERWLDSNPRPEKFAYNFDQPVWAELKHWLAKNVFHSKCAYCEAPLDLDRYSGDAEHFRPKGRVTLRDQSGSRTFPQCGLPDGSVINHPGYFWLAYSWRNLMPACSFCNSGDGKVDQFPLVAGSAHGLLRQMSDEEAKNLEQTYGGEVIESPKGSGWYLLPSRALDDEESPTLLNPLCPSDARAPHKHLRYGIGGTVVAIDGSPLGVDSINVYGLRRDVLMRKRQRAQEDIRFRYFTALMSGADEEMIKSLLRPYHDGEEDFSSAALDFVSESVKLQNRAIGGGS